MSATAGGSVTSWRRKSGVQSRGSPPSRRNRMRVAVYAVGVPAAGLVVLVVVVYVLRNRFVVLDD